MGDLDRLRAAAHPLRLRILSALTGAAMSGTELARHLGSTQANVSYHLRQLEAAGLVAVVERAHIRGGVAKRYRHLGSSSFDEADGMNEGAAVPDVSVAAVLSAALQARAAESVPGPHVTVDAELWVDSESWRTAVAAIGKAVAALHAAAVAPGAEDAVRVGITASLFAMDGSAGAAVSSTAAQ